MKRIKLLVYWQLIFVMIHLHIALSVHGIASLQLYIQKGKEYFLY